MLGFPKRMLAALPHRRTLGPTLEGFNRTRDEFSSGASIGTPRILASVPMLVAAARMLLVAR